MDFPGHKPMQQLEDWTHQTITESHPRVSSINSTPVLSANLN